MSLIRLPLIKPVLAMLLLLLAALGGQSPLAQAKEASAAKSTPESPCGPTPDLAVFEGEDGLYGYEDSAGRVVIPPRFPIAADFSGPLAAVVAAQGWVYIDATGRVVVRPFVFDNGPDYFSEGLARFVEAGRIGFMDRCGTVVIPARHDFAWPFQNGRAQVCQGCRSVQDGEHSRMVGGTRHFIDRQGNILPE